MLGSGNFVKWTHGSSTVPNDPVSPAAIQSNTGIWPLLDFKTPPLDVKWSPTEPGRKLLVVKLATLVEPVK